MKARGRTDWMDHFASHCQRRLWNLNHFVSGYYKYDEPHEMRGTALVVLQACNATQKLRPPYYDTGEDSYADSERGCSDSLSRSIQLH